MDLGVGAAVYFRNYQLLFLYNILRGTYPCQRDKGDLFYQKKIEGSILLSIQAVVFQQYIHSISTASILLVPNDPH